MISIAYMILVSISILIPTLVAKSRSSHSSKSVEIRTAASPVSQNYRLFEIYEKSDDIRSIRDKLDALAEQLRGSPEYDTWLLSYAGRRACVAEAKLRADAVKSNLIRKGIRNARVRVIDAVFLRNGSWNYG
jgi:hypothetical protein